ncbi:hypothetical protein AVEN_202253-1 [Araneus ventricosus]|uniref:ATP-dependent DNA helicase n=1 Tax=Araneus ventricosus TaxID=182803 RepID=A0A4Y2CMI3_ARAVE|nr:hypothetical protein AVEN_202253-1 [Araneus ventricosus]
MSHKTSVEALDRTMCDLRSTNSPMGGFKVLFSGDFRQILPVVTKGTRADEVSAPHRSSCIWPELTTLALKTNMRALLSSEDNSLFADLLLKVGNTEMLMTDYFYISSLMISIFQLELFGN